MARQPNDDTTGDDDFTSFCAWHKNSAPGVLRPLVALRTGATKSAKDAAHVPVELDSRLEMAPSILCVYGSGWYRIEARDSTSGRIARACFVHLLAPPVAPPGGTALPPPPVPPASPLASALADLARVDAIRSALTPPAPPGPVAVVDVADVKKAFESGLALGRDIEQMRQQGASLRAEKRANIVESFMEKQPELVLGVADKMLDVLERFANKGGVT